MPPHTTTLSGGEISDQWLKFLQMFSMIAQNDRHNRCSDHLLYTYYLYQQTIIVKLFF